MKSKDYPAIHGTTIIGMKLNGKAALAGDGQVTLNEMVFKAGAKKIRKFDEYEVLVGFAGGAADGMALLQRFEEKLSEHHGNIPRAAVELAKDWRTDRYLRRLEAMLAVVSKEHCFVISGTGDVVEPDDGICAIGSGAGYALSAARAILTSKNPPKEPDEIVRRSLEIASEICIYTNNNISAITL